MELKLDLTKEYGVVLEGGGARGAYQVGVWRALREHGIKIKGIAGTSVGALNGALMCQDDLPLAEHLWSTISYGKVLSGSEELLGKISAHRERLLHSGEPFRIEGGDLKEMLGAGLQVIREGGFDTAPLKKLIERSIDPKKIKNADRELYVVTFSLDTKKEMVVDVRKQAEDSIGDVLMASAYFPAFKQEKLGGKSYMDGGMVNNVPIDVLAEAGYEDIIVIRIYGIGYDRKLPHKLKKQVRLYKVAPTEDLGGMLGFDREKAKYNLKLGYYDGLRFLYGLSGKKYYFDCDETEKLCYNIEIMEKIGAELSIPRFRIYRPHQFLMLLKRAEEKRLLEGKASVLEKVEGDGFFTRLADSLKG